MTVYKGTELIAGIATVVDKSERIGQIVTSTIPLSDAGLHLLDGALISGSGIYSDFVDYIATLSSTNPECFDTEANWQSAVTTYGVCSKFVYDNVANTVRLPKWGNQAFTTTNISTAKTLGVKGNGITLGFTDGTNNVGVGFNSSTNYLYSRTGAYGSSVGTSMGSSSAIDNSKTVGLTTDSTKSGIAADLPALTNQYGVDCYYYIVIASTTKTQIEVDIDEIATDLNGKADTDLSNLTTTQSTNFDGQWVTSTLVVLDNVSVSTTATESNLSTYLPNDNYSYEVRFAINVNSNQQTVNVYGDNSDASLANNLAIRGTTTSQMITIAGLTCFVNGDRKLYTRTSSGTATATVALKGYRRIGTNS